MRPSACLLLAGLVVAADGLRCYVCNSKADIRCANPIQAAEESNEDRNENRNGNSYNNNNNNYNSNNNNNNNKQTDEGLQMVDCKVANNVRQAMDAVSGLMTRLGQRAPGGGDVWAAVRTASQNAATSGTSPQGGGSTGGGTFGGGSSGGGSPGGFSLFGQRGASGHDDQESNAACHKVEMDVDGELVTDRGCAPGRVLGQEPCEALAASLGDPEFCELCDGDGCNASSSVKVSFILTAVALALQHRLALL